MLPKNNLRLSRMRKLRIFPTAEHAFRDFPLTSFAMPPRTLRDRRLGWPMPAGFEAMNPGAYARRMQASRLRGAPPPDVGFDDLLSQEERDMIASLAGLRVGAAEAPAAAAAAKQQQPGAAAAPGKRGGS
jgi:large subunit ribosomal protein L13